MIDYDENEDEFGDQRCRYCGTLENVDLEYQLCNKCLDELPNKTGYCSVSCMVYGDCDGSC